VRAFQQFLSSRAAHFDPAVPGHRELPECPYGHTASDTYTHMYILLLATEGVGALSDAAIRPSVRLSACPCPYGINGEFQACVWSLGTTNRNGPHVEVDHAVQLGPTRLPDVAETPGS